MSGDSMATAAIDVTTEPADDAAVERALNEPTEAAALRALARKLAASAAVPSVRRYRRRSSASAGSGWGEDEEEAADAAATRRLEQQIALWGRVAALEEAAATAEGTAAAPLLECRRTLAALWLRRGAPDRALAQLDEARTGAGPVALGAPPLARAESLRAAALFALGRYEDAATARQRAVQLYRKRLQQPGNKINGGGGDSDSDDDATIVLELAREYSQLGGVLEVQGHFARALEALAAGQALLGPGIAAGDGGDDEARRPQRELRAELGVQVGTLHDRLGEYAQAVTELEPAVDGLMQLWGTDDPQVQEVAYILEMARMNAEE